MRYRRRHPQAPVNVRLIGPDGTEYPVELVHLGLRDGLDVWQATTMVPIDITEEFRVTADAVPPRSEIRVQVPRP